MQYLIGLGERAKAAKTAFVSAGTQDKNRALTAIAEALQTNKQAILEANDRDMAAAGEKGVPTAMLDRLRLTPERIEAIADAVMDVVTLPDPVGVVLGGSTRPNGLRIQKVAVPMGVVAMIFEARPNVTVDAAALCLKSGNVCMLRGGSEAIHTNVELVRIMRGAIAGIDALPEDCILLVEDTSREVATELMRLNGYIDLLVPRGGAGLIRSVVKNATVPVIETGAGVCHVYIHNDADFDMAKAIAVNAKVSRPSVCNSAETLLIHEDIAELFLPEIAGALMDCGVALRGCPLSCDYVPEATAASDDDYATEYNDLIMNVRVVDSLDAAVRHIAKYGTAHSEVIITEGLEPAAYFTAHVDAAAVYVNASTRFTDGAEFGMGAEIGISTQKLHARGPMGLPELTTTKYIVHGSGQIRI